MNIFPDNKIGNYTTKMFSPIDLDGKWEVSLAEITYPLAWHIRPPGKFVLKEKNGKNHEYQVKFLINDDAVSVVEKFNKYFKSRIGNNINFYYKNYAFGFTFDTNMLSSVYMDEHIASVLGFTINKAFNLDIIQEYRALKEFNLDVLNAFYIYSDIVTHQYIGDVIVKVLRVISIDHDYSTNAKYINKIYDTPHYVALERNNIDDINICIKNSLGENIAFEFGNVTIKLHFRQKYY
jgi:hypothetical protein